MHIETFCPDEQSRFCCRTALFDGAAVSAFFAVILVILFTVGSFSTTALFELLLFY